MNEIFEYGFASHYLELDDGHRKAMLHPGVIVFSTLIPFLKAEKINHVQFKKAVMLGYEIIIYLGSVIQPYHKLSGYHATATCGSIASALSIASANDYNADQMKSTLAAAVTSSSGLLAMIDDDSELKPYNIAQACINGYLAAKIG